jgi:hypothetical protein
MSKHKVWCRNTPDFKFGNPNKDLGHFLLTLMHKKQEKWVYGMKLTGQPYYHEIEDRNKKLFSDQEVQLSLSGIVIPPSLD